MNGLVGVVLQSNKMTLYTHCHSHISNLGVSSLSRIIGFRNVKDAIKAISHFSNLSPKRQKHLEKLRKIFQKLQEKSCWMFIKQGGLNA